MKHIILIGYMGAGKSSVGAKLSYRYKIPFEDTDKIIERRQNMAVSEIFERYGEDAFRKMETDVLAEMGNRKTAAVIALGGGTPMRPENHEKIRSLGTVIYLRTAPETVAERLRGDMTRPLLRGGGIQKIEAMLAVRGPVYEMLSDYIIDTDGKDLQDIAGEIEEKINETACN